MKPFVIPLSLFAGIMDTTTGVLLVTAPATALGLAGVAMPGGAAATIQMRWIGVFVTGIGLSYLWAIAPRPAATRAQRLHGVWGTTAMVRAGVAVFCSVAVATGELDPVWIIVGLTDAFLAIVQIFGLRAGWLAS